MADAFDSVAAWRLLGACAFTIYDASGWSWFHYILWAALIIGAMDILARLVTASGKVLGYDQPSLAIPMRGKPLQEFATIDRYYITINKLLTALFTYHVIRYVWYSPHIAWALEEVSVANTLLPLVLFYVLYDLGYAVFHRILHLRAFYKHVHKHHHRQAMPFRGNLDAINVHWFEFVVGEYNHLATMHAIALALAAASGSMKVIHVAAPATFIILGGVLASLNHTRYDARFPIPGLSFVYQVRYHDIHHWSPKVNFGQYTMLWDWAMGTFKAYPEGKAALPPTTEGSLYSVDEDKDA